ncbi:MAG: TadE family protein [Acidobacteriota bacterium]
MRHRQSRRTRGQTLTEFAILITFFLFVFFSIIQVCLLAIEKFHMNHYALYAARTWSVCPCMLPDGGIESVHVNEALARVKLGEYAKKLATSRNMNRSDVWRAYYMWGTHTSDLGALWSSGLSPLAPPWTDGEEGPIYIEPMPVIMPYANFVMGGGGTFPIPVLSNIMSQSITIPIINITISVSDIFNAMGITPPPTTFNFNVPDLPDPTANFNPRRIQLAYTFIPMQKEPEEDSEQFDNDRDLTWLDMIDTGGLF